MKIILCTFLLCITAVSVFGESLELNGIVGKSIEFPAAVKNGGNLIYSSKANAGVTIGEVTGGSLTVTMYIDRLDWDSSTGYFSLSGLKLEDSGVYTVNNTDGQSSVSTFHLTVRKDAPVSKPHLSVTRNEYRCTILCAAVRGTRVTLSWYREDEKESISHSSVHSAPFNLSMRVERSGTYTCEAKNSVSNEKASITVGADCRERELHGVVGKSIEFPAAVKIEGSLMYSGVLIGDVASSRFTAPHSEKFSGRVQRDSNTGLFSLSGLKMEDSGEYKVQNTQQNINTVFQLNVYKDNVNVSKPHVSVTHDEFPCTLLCAVERGTEVTLSWYREGQKKPYVTSPVESAPGLHLPVRVERSGTYTCEAKNSVSNEKASITVGVHCTGGAAGIWQAEGSKMWSLCLVLIVMLCSRLV